MLVSLSFAVVLDYGEITMLKEKRKIVHVDPLLTCLTKCFPRWMAYLAWKKIVTFLSLFLIRHVHIIYKLYQLNLYLQYLHRLQ